MENNLQSCLDSNEDYAVRVRDAFHALCENAPAAWMHQALKAHITTPYRYQGATGGAAWTPMEETKLCNLSIVVK